MKLRLLVVASFLIGACGDDGGPAVDTGVPPPDGSGPLVFDGHPPDTSAADAHAKEAAAGDGPDAPAANLDAPDAPADVPNLSPDASGDGGDAPSNSTGDTAPGVVRAISCAQCETGFNACNSTCDNGGFRTSCHSCVPTGPGICNKCSPCFFAHAAVAPMCSATGACVMGACDGGWGDCDGDPSNGCETSLRTPTACGQCGRACADAQFCAADGCRDACQPPLTACGRVCVDLVTDPAHCGGCGTSCFDPKTQCRAGTCQALPPTPCNGTMCGDKCTDLATDPANCGACGTTCDLTPSKRGGGAVRCVGGACVRHCGPGFTLCGSTECVSLANDAPHCGACGRACGSGEICVSGACAAKSSVYLASGLTDPLDLAVDADFVYWTDVTDGTISRVPRNGGAASVLARNQSKPARIAVDATHVYWSNTLAAAVMRAPKDGSGTPEMLATAVAPTDLAVVGDAVYWVNNSGTHELRKAPRAGGSSSVIATCGSYEGYEGDPTAPTFNQLVRDGTLLFFGCPSARDYSVVRVDTGNADAKVMLTDGFLPYRGPTLAVGGDYACHLVGGTAKNLACLHKNGGPGSRWLSIYYGADAPTAPSPGQMVTSSCGLVWWASLSGGGASRGDFVSWDFKTWPVNANRGAVQPRRTVVDGGFLFFTDTTAVVKMPVP